MGSEAGEGQDVWPLQSGSWRWHFEQGFLLDRTAFGHPTASGVTAEDIDWLLEAGNEAEPGRLVPPEFGFSAATGKPVQRRLRGSSAVRWIPPYGVGPVADRAATHVRGLRQTHLPIALTRQAQRQPESEPDASLPVPPEGDYEFLSLPAATRRPCLLALDPDRGFLYAWLPASRKWAQLNTDGSGVFARSVLPRADWRCEVVTDGLHSHIFIPTEEGLARLTPDVPALRFETTYAGGTSSLGAPIMFADRMWIPLRDGEGAVQFAAMTLDGAVESVVELHGERQQATGMKHLHAPLADRRLALWLSADGQFQLRRRPNGDHEARFVPWPSDVQPQLQFGSAFLSRDGAWWQLCFDGRHSRYVYCKLGEEHIETEPATTPRPCTGIYNFRFATKTRADPWREPDHGDDSTSNAVVLPILESTATSAVVGVRAVALQGLAAVYELNEPVRVELVIDDDNSQMAFHVTAMTAPWRLRVFIHDGRLWAYHPLLGRIHGWDLRA